MTASADSLLNTYANTQKKFARHLLIRNTHRRIKKQIRTIIKRTNKVSTKSVFTRPRIKVELLIERRAEVELFRYLGYSKSGYAICPKCGYSLEREYQQHCEVCGQLLGWKKFAQNEVIVQRKFVLSKENRNVILPRSPKSIQTEQHFLKWGDLKYDRLSYYCIKKIGKNQSGSISEVDPRVHDRVMNVCTRQM